MTLEELRVGMMASGRPLTERAARNWWTKGLLPRPSRKWMGRAKGSVTYWPDGRVAAQAEAAHDFLAGHSRTYSAALHLWLVGFPVELPIVRGSYRRMIGRHFRLMQRHAHDDPADRISALAARISRHLVKAEQLSRPTAVDLTDLLLPFLETIFSVNWTFERDQGLAELWNQVEPHFGGTGASEAWALDDRQLDIAASYLRRMGSLPAQRDAIRSASDYELIRARRLLLFVLGYLRRLAEITPHGEAAVGSFRNLWIVMSRPAAPILVMVLREDRLRHQIVGFLLEAAVVFRQRMRSGDFAREQWSA